MPDFVYRLGRHYVHVQPSPGRPTFYASCTCSWNSRPRIIKEDARELGRKHAVRANNKDRRGDKNRDVYDDDV